MRTFRILSALLCYPEAEMLGALDDMRVVLRSEALLPDDRRHGIEHFMTSLSETDLLDAQENYVGLFDRNRSLSLHLYEHVHGDSRERGEAMVRLVTLYRLHGLDVAANELPDYLPLYLEFLSQLPSRAACSFLAEAAHVIAALAEKLEARRSAYAAVLRAVEALAAKQPQPFAVAETLQKLAPDADSLVELDRQWEDEAVRFTAAGGPQETAMAPACGR